MKWGKPTRAISRAATFCSSCEIGRNDRGVWWNGTRCIPTEETGTNYRSGCSQVADAPRLETHCPGAPNLTVHRPVGPECAPCWDNPSLSGSLPPGEWRTINFTAPPTLPGQWSVVGVGSKGWGRKEVNFNSSFARQLPPQSFWWARPRTDWSPCNECQLLLIMKERLSECMSRRMGQNINISDFFLTARHLDLSALY